MAQIMYGQSDLYNMAQTLQKGFNVNTEITYELKLPQKEGEKGYFVRKDQTWLIRKVFWTLITLLNEKIYINRDILSTTLRESQVRFFAAMDITLRRAD